MDPDAADRRKDKSWRQLTEKKPGHRPGFFDGLALVAAGGKPPPPSDDFSSGIHGCEGGFVIAIAFSPTPGTIAFDQHLASGMFAQLSSCITSET